MNKLIFIKNSLAAKRQRGVTMIEYALLAALIAIAAIATLLLLGPEINNAFDRVLQAIQPTASGT